MFLFLFQKLFLRDNMELSLLFCLSFLYSYILSTSFFLKRKGSANARVAPITTVEYCFEIQFSKDL